MRVFPFHAALTCILLCSSGTVSPTSAQWTVGVTIGADRFWGGSVETDGEERSFRPYRPTVLGIGLEHKGNPFAWGLQIHYAEAGLGLEGQGAAAVIEGVFTVLSVSPELVYRITAFGPITELRFHAGPLVDIWGIIDEDTRAHIGAQSAVSLDIPFGGRFAGSALAGVAVIPSPFEAGQLGSTFEPRTLWRRRFAMGLHYRL
jgi:hypothetical protein